MITCQSRRGLLLVPVVAALALAGCASPGASTSAAGSAVVAEAPTYRVGDRWVYRVNQQFRAAPDFDETVEITAVGPDGITARVTAKGGPIDIVRTERWAAPGLVLQGSLLDIETRKFAEPLQRFRFPLRSGERWNQWVEQVNETQKTSGKINRYVTVLRSERVTTPAGTFDALRMNVIMQLDDEDPFRYATQATHIVWYAPAVRGVVREERRAQYREKGSGRDAFANLPVQNEIVELVSFTPGR